MTRAASTATCGGTRKVLPQRTGIVALLRWDGGRACALRAAKCGAKGRVLS